MSDVMHLMIYPPWISSTFHTAQSWACPVHSPPCRLNSLTYLHRGSPAVLVFSQHKMGIERTDAQCIYSPFSRGIYPLLPHSLGQAVSIKVSHCGKYTGTYGMHPCRCTTCKVSHGGGQAPEEWYLVNLGKLSNIINPIYRILHQLIYSFHSRSNSELHIQSPPGQIHDDEAPQDLL